MAHGLSHEAELEVYQAVLRRIGELINAEPGTKEAAELDFLTTVADSYEERAFPAFSTAERLQEE